MTQWIWQILKWFLTWGQDPFTGLQDGDSSVNLKFKFNLKIGMTIIQNSIAKACCCCLQPQTFSFPPRPFLPLPFSTHPPYALGLPHLPIHLGHVQPQQDTLRSDRSYRIRKVVWAACGHIFFQRRVRRCCRRSALCHVWTDVLRAVKHIQPPEQQRPTWKCTECFGGFFKFAASLC